MRFDILTLFPDMVRTVLGESILGRAAAAGHIEVHAHNIRDYSTDRRHRVDDTPFGGGAGMILACQPVADCIRAVRAQIPEGNRTRVIYMSPKGRCFNHDVARELSSYDGLILLCGHYEGIDQRVLDAFVDEEISVGDYVLTGGELPACLVVDAVSRLLDGVLAAPECYEEESVASGILEYPQYTKPRVFEGREVPAVLLEGDHAKIDRWRLEQAVALTRERRPDLLRQHPEFEEALKPKEKRRKKYTPPTQDKEGSD